MPSRIVLSRPGLAILLLLVNPTLQADTVYKTVDDDGKVTYSATPPVDAGNSAIIDIQPPPSADQVEDAQRRHQENLKTATQLDEQRQARNKLAEEENRLRREKQIQLQLQQQAEKNNSNDDNIYPYIPGRRPLPGRPPVIPPERPVTLPIRP